MFGANGKEMENNEMKLIKLRQLKTINGFKLVYKA